MGFIIDGPMRGLFIGGMEVVIDYSQTPKMKCSDEFVRLQTPELVEQTNQWMAEFFGYDWTIPTGTVQSSVKAIMNPDTYHQLKTKLRIRNYDF